MQALLDFLDKSPTPFQAITNAKAMLDKAGFTELHNHDDWQQLDAGKYYTTRNDSSMIAFVFNGDRLKPFRMIGAHTDSPCLKLKPNPILMKNGYHQIALDVYGGALLNPWFDRDLAIAGRVTVMLKNGNLKHIPVNSEQPIAVIPSLAIHLDGSVNKGREVNKQLHLPAIIACNTNKEQDFQEWIMQFIEASQRQEIDSILSHELSLYDAQKAAIIGKQKEILLSARLDNLLSCYAALNAITANHYNTNCLLVLNDHEEVGSDSTSGAGGPFLYHSLARIIGQQNLEALLQKSFFLSVDNAHAIHPNYSDKHEPNHAPRINAGPVIKINHNQRYATNSETEAIFKAICKKANVMTQSMVVRADMACGSTIGPITATRTGVRTIDIGVPQLAMHSIREMAGTHDQKMMWKVLKTFYAMSDEALQIT